MPTGCNMQQKPCVTTNTQWKQVALAARQATCSCAVTCDNRGEALQLAACCGRTAAAGTRCRTAIDCGGQSLARPAQARSPVANLWPNLAVRIQATHGQLRRMERRGDELCKPATSSCPVPPCREACKPSAHASHPAAGLLHNLGLGAYAAVHLAALGRAARRREGGGGPNGWLLLRIAGWPQKWKMQQATRCSSLCHTPPLQTHQDTSTRPALAVGSRGWAAGCAPTSSATPCRRALQHRAPQRVGWNV